MPFIYRLQKILDFRIRKKEEQLIAVQYAQRDFAVAVQNIKQNNNEIEMIKNNQRHADALMMESYDKFLHHLWEKGKQLEIIKKEKLRLLEEEIHKLVELEKAVKVLEKHKEKNREAYIEEKKKAELKTFSEIAVQRHFRQTQQKIEDEELLKQMDINEIDLKEIMESEKNNEY